MHVGNTELLCLDYMKEQKPKVVKDNQFHIINVCVVKLSILRLQVEEELSKVSFVEELQNNDHLQQTMPYVCGRRSTTNLVYSTVNYDSYLRASYTVTGLYREAAELQRYIDYNILVICFCYLGPGGRLL